MAIYHEDIVDVELENGNIYRSFANHSIGKGDDDANRFGVRLFRNGEAVGISGASCIGLFMAPNGDNILINGNGATGTDGNLAWVQLPQACYNYSGNFTLAIKVVDSQEGITGTMRIIDGVVNDTGTSGAVAPTGAVPTYQEILDVYDDMLSATVLAFKNDDIMLNGSDFKTELPDMDDATANTLIGYYMTDKSTQAPLHFPSDGPDVGFVFTVKQYLSNDLAVQYTRQMLIDSNTMIPSHYRVYTAGSWGNWETLPRTNLAFYNDDIMYTQGNFKTKFSDMNDLTDNTLIGFYMTNISSQAPAHYPTTGPLVGFALTIKQYQSNALANKYKRQILYNVETMLPTHYRIYTSNAWGDWVTLSNGGGGQVIIECGTGKTYTTLRSAIAAAIGTVGARVIVYPGTYDLAQEFSDVIGQATWSGICLKNKVHVEFMAGAYVKALFPTSNDNISTYFQPFYGAEGGFTLDGLDIEASNCRYCVHDEYSSIPDAPYHNIYRNCKMKMTVDESSGITEKFPQCIGGGLGKHGYIEIIGGNYQSICVGYSSDTYATISYHNYGGSGAFSRIAMRDIYLKDECSIWISSHGTSTAKSEVQISGCNMGKPIKERYEASGDNTDNFDVVAWNNIDRSQT